MRFRALGALGASVGLAALLVTSAFGLAGGASGKDRTTGGKSQTAAATYIVQLSDDPVVAYSGELAGYKATAPAKGQKVNPNANDVKKYVAYLNGKHADAAAAVGAEKFYDYAFTFNGFAAKMSEAQAAKLATLPGVAAVSKDELQQPTTSTTPSFLGLDNPSNGLWKQVGGPAKAGENVIVGIVDTGIWPEHPSFSDQKDYVFRTGSSGKRTLAYGPAPAGWTGTCQSGEQFSQDHCTNKLIGARYFLSGFGHFGIIKSDYKSARDADSHGSHTAGTAAGNYGVKATGPAASLGTVSGMAPRARIAAYKVCWNGDAGGCANSDSMAAIDQAVADGVDVINFSISGTSTNFRDPVEIAFLFAARAGVFVAASAGNSGPDASTVAHPSPWITTVAASTHSRPNEATLTLGDGATYTGASANVKPTTGPLVNSTAVGAAGASASAVALCYPGSLDPAKAGGKIVVCDRGTIARTDKSRAVQMAGGIGMVLANTGPGSLNADLHYVPTIHIDEVDGADVKAYAATTGATATIGAVSSTPSPAPKMAAFSSRGPLRGASGNLLKPDVTAPGVDVLAAVSPDSGREFDLLSGTSMSSPHVAGLAALLRQAKPAWSPAAMKSALMTTAYDTLDGDVFAQGAGHVQPNAATDPGLVYDAGWSEYLGFLCEAAPAIFRNPAATCASLANAGVPTRVLDHNVPSIAVGSLAGVETVKRTVTNVGTAAATYTASVSGLEGVTATVSPDSLTLSPGQSASFTVRLVAQSNASYGEYTSGALTWSDGAHSVRSPIVAKPVAVAAPAEVSGTGAAQSYGIRFGYDGPFATSIRGLLAATEIAGQVSDDPTNTFVVGGPGVTAHKVVIPAGTTYARFALYDDQIATGNDLDLYVYDADGEEVGASGSGTSQEIVNLVAPAAGTYTAYVHGWQTLGSGTTSYVLYSWGLGSAAAGNMTATAPSAATTGGSGSVNLAFSGLAAGKRYLGAVDYKRGTETVGSTIVYQKTP
jgi:subtilisin family serine protease